MGSYEADVADLHRIGYQGAGVRIGSLDTGVDGSHPALSGRIEQFRYFDPGGFSFRDCDPFDSGWHGTHLAGLMVGGRSGEGFVGIAPEARLVSGAVIENGYILARILLGLDWLAGCDLSILNLAIGLPMRSPVLRTLVRALTERDILVVAPIGNRGAGAAGAPGIYPEVLSVGAADDSGGVAKFSGSVNHAVSKACGKPDLVAPGVDIVSTLPGGAFGARGGTSVSSAIVAGMAALLREAFPRACAATISHALRATCGPVASSQALRTRHGAVRVKVAFEYLERGCDTTPRCDPPAGCSPAFIDPRLSEKLAYAKGDERADAILEFIDHDARESFEHAFLAARSEHRPDQDRLLKLRHIPACIMRCPARLIRAALESQALRVASACDVDRGSHFS
jgi:subtilisin family serine protease